MSSTFQWGDITTSNTFDEISFVLPQAPTQSGHISVTAIGGTVESAEIFYPLENVILNYDGIGSHVWGDCSFVVADGSSAPYVSNGTCLGITGTVSASNLLVETKLFQRSMGKYKHHSRKYTD